MNLFYDLPEDLQYYIWRIIFKDEVLQELKKYYYDYDNGWRYCDYYYGDYYLNYIDKSLFVDNYWAYAYDDEWDYKITYRDNRHPYEEYEFDDKIYERMKDRRMILNDFK